MAKIHPSTFSGYLERVGQGTTHEKKRVSADAKPSEMKGGGREERA